MSGLVFNTIILGYYVYFLLYIMDFYKKSLRKLVYLIRGFFILTTTILITNLHVRNTVRLKWACYISSITGNGRFTFTFDIEPCKGEIRSIGDVIELWLSGKLDIKFLLIFTLFLLIPLYLMSKRFQRFVYLYHRLINVFIFSIFSCSIPISNSLVFIILFHLWFDYFLNLYTRNINNPEVRMHCGFVILMGFCLYLFLAPLL